MYTHQPCLLSPGGELLSCMNTQMMEGQRCREGTRGILAAANFAAAKFLGSILPIHATHTDPFMNHVRITSLDPDADGRFENLHSRVPNQLANRLMPPPLKQRLARAHRHRLQLFAQRGTGQVLRHVRSYLIWICSSQSTNSRPKPNERLARATVSEFGRRVQWLDLPCTQRIHVSPKTYNFLNIQGPRTRFRCLGADPTRSDDGTDLKSPSACGLAARVLRGAVADTGASHSAHCGRAG